MTELNPSPSSRIDTVQQPTVRFMLAHPLHLLALGFGSGLSPFAPGTIGTLFAWGTYRALDLTLPAESILLLIMIGFVVGIVAIEKTGTALGEIDHGSIVWDEIVPFWAVLWTLSWVMGDSLVWQGLAFAFFRLYDISKPWPARYYDRKVKNGYGVMMDDVVAAVFTILTMALLMALIYLGAHAA